MSERAASAASSHDPSPATAAASRMAFAGVFASSLCVLLGVGCVLPILPRYVSGPLDGGDIAVGLVIGAFAFTALVARPLAGRIADTRGRRVVVVSGAVLAGAGGALYLLPAGILGLVLARLVLGIGEGFVFTAGAAWVVDLAPESRRGQALGLFGLSVWTGLTVGPLAGQALFASLGYDAVWVMAALAPLVGAALATRLPDVHAPAPAIARTLVPRAALRPGVALTLAAFGFAAISSFIVLHLDRLEAGPGGHGAAVFTAFAASVVGSRIIGSRLPDRFGAARSAVLAGTAETAGLTLVAVAGGWPVAMAGAMLMGAGFSLLYPSLALMVVNRAGEEQRGAALGTFTAFFDLGMGIGAPLAGAVAAVTGGYPATFGFAAGCAAAGVAVTAFGPGGLKREQPR